MRSCTLCQNKSVDKFFVCLLRMAVEMTNAGGMLIVTDWHCFQVQGEYNPANGIACGVILGHQLTGKVGTPLATPFPRGDQLY